MWSSKYAVGLGAGLMIALLLAVPLYADDVTFLDSTDNVSASTSSSRVTITAGGCPIPVEGCIVTINAPSGFTFLGFLGLPVGLVVIGEGDGTVSDAIQLTPSSDGTSVQVEFVSDDPAAEGLSPTCSTFPTGCQINEDGTVQLATEIEWGDANGNTTSDTIHFQSDVETVVPEPASLTLLASSLILIGFVTKPRCS